MQISAGSNGSQVIARSWVFACCFLAGALPSARSQANQAQLSSMGMHGTIGPYRIGLTYTVNNNTELVSAEYFYDTQLKDIPLTGKVQGQSVEWKGADGSVFHLHFVGNGTSGNQPLTFYNSVGLAGSWTLGTRTLPVTLDGGYSIENPSTRQYAQVTTVSDAAFEASVRDTISAILRGDRAATATHVHFPLRVNGTPHRVIHSAADLDRQWSTVFTPTLLAKLRSDVPHYMFVHNGEAMLGSGEVWFDNKGLLSITP